MIKRWWKEAVVYEIYVRSFKDSDGDGIGDLRGILHKLDYLDSLGVDVLWLTPIFPSPWRDSGYDVADYDGIDPRMGSLEDFKILLEGIHKRGMKLVLDLVINHTSEEHSWFKESRSSLTNPKRNFYIWRPPRNGAEPNNWRSLAAGSAWEWDAPTGEYYLHLFSKYQPDLNWWNPEVKEKIFDSMRLWLKRGIDGFRMDVINCLMKPKGLPDAPRKPGDTDKYVLERHLYADNPGMHELLQDMNREVLTPYGALAIGEVHFNTKEEARLFVEPDRRELDLIFEPDVLFDRKGMQSLRKSIDEWETVRERGWNGFALGNHDTARQVSALGDDRRYWSESAKLLATLVLTAPGTPFLYQGDELGMTNVSFPTMDDYRDIEMKNFYEEKVDSGIPPEEAFESLKPVSRDNSRTPMQWDSSRHGGFTRGSPWININPNYTDINVAAQEKDPNSILNYYRKAIAFRKRHLSLTYGDYRPILEDHPQVYAFRRTLPEESLLVVLNFSSMTVSLSQKTVLAAGLPERDRPLFSNLKRDIADWNLSPWEARIYNV